MQLTALIKKALISQSILIDFDEHIGIPADKLPSLAVREGMQVRVSRKGYADAIFTVRVITGTEVRMGYNARQKIGGGSDFEVTITNIIASSWLSDEAARTGAALVERLSLAGSFCLAMAPHGGDIEVSTHLQAALVMERLRSRGCSYWATLGFDTPWPREINAHQRWHITSADMHDESFPYLGMALSQKYQCAVAFHGFSEDYILVGGMGSESLRTNVTRAIASVMNPHGVSVRMATDNEPNSGSAPRNMVNRATERGLGSVQIEQPRNVRLDYWSAVAEAVASVLIKL